MQSFEVFYSISLWNGKFLGFPKYAALDFEMKSSYFWKIENKKTKQIEGLKKAPNFLKNTQKKWHKTKKKLI